MNTTPEELAAAASEQGTFSFLDRLNGRNFPVEKVTVYLDEAAGYEITKLNDQLSRETDDEKVADLEDRLGKLTQVARQSAYIFTLRGISSEDYDSKIIDKLEESIPAQYNEFTSPLTGRTDRELKPDTKRDELFNSLLWSEFIESIEEGATGAVAGKPTPEETVLYRRQLPLDGVRQIGIAINKLRMTTEWMNGIQDEGFFPTP